ncbi:MAG: bacillithiol system redox-active protein YtxJ [Cyclobacteriaceae bacterium]
MSHSLNWKPLSTKEQFEELLEKSRTKPALVFKHRPSSPESTKVKESLEEEWTIAPDHMDLFIVDVMKDKEVSYEVTETAGVMNEFPQVLLFADGVTMYDEAHEMINVKKIKLALKIINRTFKWMETRV